MIVFDPDKDAANLAKHGVSLARAGDMVLEEAVVIVDGRRDYGESRFRAFGFIDGQAHCLVFTIREDRIRAISLRRAHLKEMKRYVPRD
jgi:Uncharacterized protein conserved in bacteria